MAKVDEIGKWSEEKLELLRQYLAAYTSIMTVVRERKDWPKEFAYVDAFAGSVNPVAKQIKRPENDISLPGLEDIKAANKYIDGSPLVALKTKPVFDAYFLMIKMQQELIIKLNR